MAWLHLFSLRNKHNFLIAFEAVQANRVRSLLTALGIIFGVAAVITMMAVGKGTEQEVLEQIDLVGVNNIIISPKSLADDLDSPSGSKQAKKFTPGLTLKDAENLKKGSTAIKEVCPEVSYDVQAIANGRRTLCEIKGVSSNYFSVFNILTENGKYFSQHHTYHFDPVCIIGKEVQAKLFPSTNPIGKRIKCGNIWYKIIDVLAPSGTVSDELREMGINQANEIVFVPIETLLLRYKNNQLVTEQMINSGHDRSGDDGAESSDKERRRRAHQLSKITVQVENTDMLKGSVDFVNRKLTRMHNNVVDFQIQVPELLLKQQQKTKETFKFVLLAIAAISLIVGGIGIMNIMLASVMERIREIGLRLAIGAKKTDVQLQFIFEALVISVLGGVVGILLGIGLAWGVESLFGVRTIISTWSVLISFGVSAMVGVVFGYFPAKKAADEDPVNSLRYD
jgi:putative ABC transport system permease protein